MDMTRRKLLAGLFLLPAASLVPKVPWWRRWYRVLRGKKAATARQFMDAGYVYMPYVPLLITTTMLDPNDFKSNRYQGSQVREDFYGKVTSC